MQRLLALAALAVVTAGLAAPASAHGTADAAVAPAAGPVTVVRYTFDAGTGDSSGRGRPFTVRTAAGGTVQFPAVGAGRYATFPAACPRTAASCPRALLETPDYPDLDPGTRAFGWGASVLVTKAHVVGSSNVLQKGVTGTGSLWKLQLGATAGKAQCVVSGRGSATAYLVRSSGPVADGRWHRLFCQRSGATLTVFVDGVRSGAVAIPAALSLANTLPLRIGGPNFNTSSDMYHGWLDEVSAVLG